jgi:hypothetical protein
MSKSETIKIQTIVRVKNGDRFKTSWIGYTSDEADEMMTKIRKVGALDTLKIILNDGSYVYFNPDDISTIQVKIRRGLWSLPLFRSIPQ